MEEINQLLQLNIVEVLVGVIVILMSLKFIIELIDFFLNRFGIKTKKQIKAEQELQRIAKLEAHDLWQYNKLNEISACIVEIQESNKAREELDRQRTIVELGSMLNDWYDKLKNKESISRGQYETFTALAEQYIEAGGDHIMKERFIPEIKNKPIKD